MMLHAQSQTADDPKTNILVAACEVFSKYGYAKTTLDDIASRIGMSKGSLYYYYKNKDDLFSEVLHSLASDFKDRIEERVALTDNARAAIITYAETSSAYSREVAQLFQASAKVQLEIKPLASKVLENFKREMTTYLAGIIARGGKSGEFIKCDAHHIAAVIISTLEAIELKELTELAKHPASSSEEISTLNARHFVSLVLDGIAVNRTTSKNK